VENKLHQAKQNPTKPIQLFVIIFKEKKWSRFHMGILCQGPYWIINELSIHKEPNALQVCWKVKPVDTFGEQA
jgi:hypothetical protein